jgi:hypothetical protein
MPLLLRQGTPFEHFMRSEQGGGAEWFTDCRIRLSGRVLLLP